MPRLKFWGWGYESEGLTREEIAALERAYAQLFGVSGFEASVRRGPRKSSCALRA